MRALIIVDVQNDFMPDGALPVAGAYDVIPVINRLSKRFDLVVATQDWHPPAHGSFASSHDGKKPGELIDLDGLEQVLWPDHCVQGTRGADFVWSLDTGPVEAVFRKGCDPGIDSYSGFFDNGHRKATGMADYLKGRGVDEVFIVGVATDYCVAFTALDALELGFEVNLVLDACSGVDLNPGDVAKAIENLREKGARIMESTDV